jgi:hypothetical protein
MQQEPQVKVFLGERLRKSDCGFEICLERKVIISFKKESVSSLKKKGVFFGVITTDEHL